MVGKITAYECITLSSRTGLIGGAPEEYILAPLRVIFGAHILGSDQKFSGVRVRTRDIDEWASLGGFVSTVSEDGIRSLSYKQPVIEPVQLVNGAVLSLRQDAYMNGPDIRGGSMIRRLWCQVDGLDSTWSEIDSRVVTPLSSIITLCLGQVNNITGIRLTIDGEKWVELASNYIESLEPSSRLEGLARLGDLGLQGVAMWLNKVERLGPLPPVVARFSAKRASTALETELLEMTTVTEGLHARLFPEARRFSEADCELIKGRVLKAVEDMDGRVMDVLRGMLTHVGEPGYASRLKDLARILEVAVPEICGKVNKWAEAVSSARNAYAHRTAGFLDAAGIDALITVLESLRWLLRCILLMESGLDGRVLAQRLQGISGYRLFLERAAARLPTVYGA